MQTTRRTTSYLAAVWLALAFMTPATCVPALANCETAGTSGVPSACCAARSHSVCCQSHNRGMAHHGIDSGNCHVSDCPCSVSPGQSTAPLPGTLVDLAYPAILAARQMVFLAPAQHRYPPNAGSDHILRSASRSASSSRAPPFQG